MFESTSIPTITRTISGGSEARLTDDVITEKVGKIEKLLTYAKDSEWKILNEWALRYTIFEL